ncbi:MAG TPA: glycosyltransferase family 39 protein [Clostridia bacterium]|nr:glycosyltransferase family 39 protein [Clostridia bacterium]
MVVVSAIVIARFALYLYAAPRYGYFRDELYYLACGEHPAWGYVDQPPLIAWVAWLLRHTIGTSLHALRLLPALAAMGTAVVTARLAWEFGARRFGVWIASLLIVFAPVSLEMSHLFTMNAFDPLLWACCALIVVRIAKGADRMLWLLFGAICGVALLNKYAIAFFLIALSSGIVLTKWRRFLRDPYFYAGAAICLLIALPNFLWQYHRGLPFLILMRNVRESGRDIALSPLQFMSQQVQLEGFVAFAAVIAALLFFFSALGRPFRSLGWTYVFFSALMVLLKAKNYYVAPIYPIVIAAGSTAIEQATVNRPFVRSAFLALAVGSAVLFAPLFIPVFPVQTFIAYQRALRLEPPRFEHHPQGPLPQIFADMYGWPEIAQATAHYYNALPEAERTRTAIFANNFGGGAAIDFFGPPLGLPKAIGRHQNYWVWGPGQYTGESLIVINEDDPAHLAQMCNSITLVSEIHHPLARPDENMPIYHCRGLKWDLRQIWPTLQKFN